MALFDSGLSLLIYGPGPVCLSPQGREAEAEPEASVTDRQHFLTPFHSLRRGLWSVIQSLSQAEGDFGPRQSQTDRPGVKSGRSSGGLGELESWVG